MATRKAIYVDSNGDYIESAGVYEAADHINSSAGAGDAGKPIVLDAAGHIDASMINDADIDHGSIGGLSDDDHTQYILVAGTRAFTGDQSMGNNKITNLSPGTSGTDAVNKNQLDAAVAGLQDFRESVLDKDTLTPPGSPSTGDRYLIGQPSDTATGDWASHEGEITEWDGSAWVFEAQPDEGTYVYIEDENAAYIFNNNTFASGSWILFSSVVVTAGDGIDITSGVVSVDLASGGGLKIVSTELAVEPNDFAGSGLVDDGSDNLAIDWATAATDDKAWKASSLDATAGAGYIGADSSGIAASSADNVQGVLEDLDAAITAVGTPGVSYTVGTGGVSKGDLVYISANDTVLPKDITDAEYAIGLCATTESAAASVKTVAENFVLTGVLSGATAGTRYYWSGSALTTTIPATSGNYVWLCGVAKNASDLDVHVEFIKKNV